MNPLPICRNTARTLGLSRNPHLVAADGARRAGNIRNVSLGELLFHDEPRVLLGRASHPRLAALDIQQLPILSIHDCEREAPAIPAELLTADNLGVAELDVSFANEAAADGAVEDRAVGLARLFLGKREEVVPFH